MKKIPYGIASYKRIREEDCYYIDRTRYIPELEKAGDFLFLIRPRRFGKSSLLTLLECYYDIARPDEFDFLFGNTWIGENPTAEKNSQLILKFNFSQVSPDSKNVEASFRDRTDTVFLFFAEKYRNLLGDDWYGKLRHFVVLDRQLNGNFSYPTYLPECDGFLHNPLRGGNGQGLRRLVAGAVYGKISRGLLRISERIEIRRPKGIYGG